jgi:hypothetical protein
LGNLKKKINLTPLISSLIQHRFFFTVFGNVKTGASLKTGLETTECYPPKTRNVDQNMPMVHRTMTFEILMVLPIFCWSWTTGPSLISTPAYTLLNAVSGLIQLSTASF